MTYPWASGEVLTAADLNAYAGLVLVKTQTIGSAVASITVTDAFSSTFGNYRVIINGGAGTTASALKFALGASTASYYTVSLYYTYASDTPNVTRVNNGAAWNIVGETDTNTTTLNIDLIGPNLAKYTHYSGFYTGTVAGFSAGRHAVATAYTAFTVSADSGSLTGGTIRVYGYNNG